MSDKLIKAVCFDGEIRAFAVNAKETVAEAQRRHDTYSASSAALGRTMIASIMLGAMLKGDEKLTVKVMGDGPAGAIVVDANAKGEVKGYIQNPRVYLPLNSVGKIDVKGAVGTEGTLTVIKDLGLKEPFTGQVPLISGELGEDFTYYLANSEQVPSAVGLSVLVENDDSIRAAGGFMIQVMPGASEETISTIEKALEEIPRVSQLLDEGASTLDVLSQLMGEENIKVVDEMDVSFHCDCSKERFASAIITLGVKEIEDMIAEDHGAEAVCHFCNNKYHYSEEDLEELKEEAATN